CACRCDKASWRLVAELRPLPTTLPAPGSSPCLQRPPRATASGRTAEDIMNDELTARQRAISLRLAGRSVKHICSALSPTEAWFQKGWRRELEAGPDGLYDLARANHQVARRITPELERTVLRRRSTAGACGCRSCPRASWCRLGGCRWQRGG